MSPESDRCPKYFTPSERRKFNEMFLGPTVEEIELARQVEDTLANIGVIVPGSVHDQPKPVRSITIFGRNLKLPHIG